MNEYIVNFKLFSVVIEAESAISAWCDTVCKDLQNDKLFWNREDLRKYLLECNFKTLQPTLQKDVFLLNK